MEMWTAQEFANVLEEHPGGGTLWTRTHRMVRYIRVFRPDDKTVVAVMTEKWAWRGKSSNKVELFVRTPKGTEVAEFPKAEKTPEFTKTVLESPIIHMVDPAFFVDVMRFISTPDETRLATW